MIDERSPLTSPATGGPRPPWPGEITEVGDYELFVRSAGEPSAPPAVLVHGLGGSSTNWTDLMGLLSEQTCARALDLPGFGLSEPPPGIGYTLDDHASAVVSFVRSRRRGPVHLFGHSLGGAVATRVAAENPELVQRLTLVGPALPTLRPRGDNALVGMLAMPGIGARVTSRLRRLPAEELITNQMHRVFYDVGRAPAQRVEAARELEQMLGRSWTKEALTRSTRGLISAYLTRGPRSLWRQAARVAAPTLLIWGSHDTRVSPQIAETAASAFPRSRLLILEEAGHAAQIEDPVAVARAFFGLLNDLEHGRLP